MTVLRMQIGLLSFAVLSSTVLANIFYMQPVPAIRNAPSETGSSEVQTAPYREVSSAQAAAEATAAIDTVRVIQRELQARGYATGTADGSITPVLQAAIMAYEFDQGLTLTAEPNEVLKRTIILGPASAGLPAQARAKPGPLAQQVIVSTQQMMTKLGYGPLKADGEISDALAAAIRRFEREQGLTGTGRISGELAAKLAALAGLGPVPNRR